MFKSFAGVFAILNNIYRVMAHRQFPSFGKLLKVTKTRLVSEEDTGKPFGTDLSLEGEITVACGRGTLAILGVLPEGKGRMNAADFIRGRKLSVGDILQ